MAELRHIFLAVLCVGLCSSCASRGREDTTDLIREYQRAEKTAASDSIEAFSINDVTIAGVSRPAILVRPPGRIAWRLTLGHAPRLRAFVGLPESGWAVPGYGVQFRIEIVDGGRSQEVFSTSVNPHRFPQHRAWMPLDIDLNGFGDRTVQIVFIADPRSSDIVTAVWGEPAIVHSAIPGS
jgi:hypothetical protein